MNRKLIVADESIIIRKTIELILSERGFVINVISDGREALRVIEDEVPDIVFADIDLSEINGYELCRAIKKNPSLKTVQVILLAAVVKGIDEERVKEVGADDYIIKPFEPEDLLSKIETAKASKDIIAQLRNESQRLRNKLQQASKKANKIKKELLSKIEATKTSEDIIAQLRNESQRLRNELQRTEEKADKINKELVEKISLQAIPGITDRIIEEIIQGPLMAEFKNAIEKVVEQKIPYIVERIITEEIEKIKTEDK